MLNAWIKLLRTSSSERLASYATDHLVREVVRLGQVPLSGRGIELVRHLYGYCHGYGCALGLLYCHGYGYCHDDDYCTAIALGTALALAMTIATTTSTSTVLY